MHRNLHLAICGFCYLLTLGYVGSNAAFEIPREIRTSIQSGQSWLQKKQRNDGSFAFDNGKGSGIVAAGVLAWLSTGELPGEGPYGGSVALGVDFILNHAQRSGLLFKGEHPQVMYQHALATTCLAEVWGQSQDPRIYSTLRSAIELIVASQTAKGGWRYQPYAKDEDLSVTVMQLTALRSAREAGIAVPQETVRRALGFLESCRTAKDKEGLSGFAYQPGDGKRWATTAAGLMTMLLAGRGSEEQLKENLLYLEKIREKKQDREWFVYGHYYATLAHYYAVEQNRKNAADWERWYLSISKQLLAAQLDSGADKGKFNLDDKYGIWSSATCIKILAIPFKTLPMHQR